MLLSFLLRAAPAASLIALLPAAAHASSSPAFDKACSNYYSQGNDPDVMTSIAEAFCGCISGGMEEKGHGADVLEFLARTYSEDLTTFMHEYPKGEAWMDAYFGVESYCKNEADFGSNLPQPSAPIEAASWGGIVRDGPGQEHKRLTALAEGDRITLLEKTDVQFNGFPWWRIRYAKAKEGYQWGGIVCSLGEPIDGAFETCR